MARKSRETKSEPFVSGQVQTDAVRMPCGAQHGAVTSQDTEKRCCVAWCSVLVAMDGRIQLFVQAFRG